jgi:hypothetical protein
VKLAVKKLCVEGLVRRSFVPSSVLAAPVYECRLLPCLNHQPVVKAFASH